MGKSANPVGNANFGMACRYLGWGDPEGGAWFIGKEEGADFTERDLRKWKVRTFPVFRMTNDRNRIS